MGNEVSVSGVERRGGDKDAGTDKTNLLESRDKDNQRACEQSPCACFAVMPTQTEPVANYAVPEREEFADVTAGVPASEETVLGSSYLGAGVLLRECRSCEQGANQSVHRES